MKNQILFFLILMIGVSIYCYEEHVYGEYFLYCQEYSFSLWFSNGEIFYIEPGLKGKAGDYEVIKSKMGYFLRIRLKENDEFFINLNWGRKLTGCGFVYKQNVIKFNNGSEIKVEMKIEKIPILCTLEKITK